MKRLIMLILSIWLLGLTGTVVAESDLLKMMPPILGGVAMSKAGKFDGTRFDGNRMR